MAGGGTGGPGANNPGSNPNVQTEGTADSSWRHTNFPPDFQAGDAPKVKEIELGFDWDLENIPTTSFDKE
jgi:hypothetical protein